MLELTLFLLNGQLKIKLNDSDSAKLVYQGAPYQAQAQLWGDEIYFSTRLNLEEEDPVSVVEKGDVAYWQPGQAICIFWGPTPNSEGEEIRPASPVNVIGKIEGDLSILKKVGTGEIVTLSF
jgi:uncharacterized protein